MEDNVSADSSFTDNTLSHAIPMKIPFSYLVKVAGDNIFPSEYEYIHLRPKVDELELVLGEYDIFKMYGEKYYLDGTLNLGSSLYIDAGTEIFVKEGEGIVILNEASFTVQDWTGPDPVTIEGIDSSPWKGIAIASKLSSVTFRNCIISNAGNGTFSSPLFQSEYAASIFVYAVQTLRIEDSEIQNSEGYGLYYLGEEESAAQYFTFENSETTNIISKIIPHSNLVKKYIMNIRSCFL